jgi:hypothetical protein
VGRRLLALTALLLLASCSRRHATDPARDGALDPANPAAAPDPGQPGSLSAEIASNQVTLRWTLANPALAASYRVYRRSESEGQFRLAAVSGSRAAVIGGLQNGVLYLFQAAAVNSSGLEGRRSEALAARPSAYNVTIDSGALYTNGLGVTLSLSAPVGTSQTVISNDPAFADSAVFDFAAARAWTLAAGPDGARSVHVRFRDGSGNTALATDAITLDRVAEISSVTENSGGVPRVAGETVRFVLTAGEPDGSATVDVAGARSGLRLFDDATHGDATAGDGTYVLDWVVEPGLDANGATVTGRFTDAAGNTAARAAATQLTLQSPPPAVSLTAVLPVGTSSLNVFWSQSAAADFAAYRLWRAETRNVLAAPTRTVAANPAARTATSFLDTGLKEDFRYYYLVEVLDQAGLSAASGVDSATTLNDFPAAVVLDSVATAGTDRVLLTWSRNQDTDFSAYRIFQSTVPGADTTRTLAATVTSQSVTYRDVTGLAASTTYYFRVYVMDRSGRQVPSNEVRARTLP